MPRSNKFLFVCIALVAILACNVPAGQTPTTPPDFVSTITAQAVVAEREAGGQRDPGDVHLKVVAEDPGEGAGDAHGEVS